MSEWKPIETAPSEVSSLGPYILVAHDGGRVSVAYRENGRWFDPTNESDVERTRLYDVTHWMPLPKPPRADGQSTTEGK